MKLIGHARRLAFLLVCFVLVQFRGFPAGNAATEIQCWDAETAYRPPDFNAYFPDSASGAKALSVWWDGPDREEGSAAEVALVLREGLRRYEGDRAALLRWVGRRFIDRQAQQPPELIEVMYHASDVSAPADLRGPAIRFGLSAVRPMTHSIFTTFAALSMASEDPNELDCIARGIDGQRDEAMGALAIYMESNDAAVREKAAVVKQLWNLEIKAQDWVQARKREQTEAAFGPQLPTLRATLLAGTSPARLQSLERIAKNDILTIVPDSALAWFARCAIDPEAEVRAHAARMIGERWILTVTSQDPSAVELAIMLSKDVSEGVRHNAVYYGLSVVSPKDDAVILRLLEVAAETPSSELSERIAWSLRAHRLQVRTLLNDWIASEDQTRSAAGARLYRALAE